MYKQQIYETDEKGYIKEIYVAEFDSEGNVIGDVPSDYISIQPSNGLYKLKWNGTEWIEGATQEEIDELTRVEPSLPTAEERITMLEDTINFLLGL